MKDEVIAAKIRVYADEEEEYISFISLEAYSHLKEWMSYRKEAGELVTEESWLMRNLWDVQPTVAPIAIPINLFNSFVYITMRIIDISKADANISIPTIIWIGKSR